MRAYMKEVNPDLWECHVLRWVNKGGRTYIEEKVTRGTYTAAWVAYQCAIHH